MFGPELAEIYICGETQSKETASTDALPRVQRPVTGFTAAADLHLLLDFMPKRLRVVAWDGITGCYAFRSGRWTASLAEMGVGSHETIRSGIDDVERRFGRLPSGRFPSRRSGGHR